MLSCRFALCQLACLMACAAPLQSAHALPEPVAEWTVDANGVAGSPVAYPAVRPNSIVVSVGGRVTRINGQGEILFAAEFGPEASRGGIMDPSVIDLDGDGTDEIVSGHNDGLIVALEGTDGAVRWTYDLGTELTTWRMPIPADLDGDGKAEVLASNMDGWIACINHDGTLRWRSRIEEYRLSTPAVGDINNDGRMEVVYGTSTRHVIALDADGHLLWDRFHPPLHMGRTKPVIADLDGDGAAEIYTMSSMIAADTGLLCLNGADGTVKWVGATWHKAYHGLGIAQFSDGTLGILACDKGNNVGAYNADGTLRWRTQVTGRGIWTAPVQADIDGDGAHEILFTIRDNSRDGKGSAWFVLGPEGEVLGEFGGGRGYNTPLVADVDGDGVLEVVISFASGEVVCYSFGGTARDSAVVAADWLGPAYPAGGAVAEKAAAEPPSRQLVRPEASILYGLRPVTVDIPAGSGADAVEISAGPTWRRVFRAEDGAHSIDAHWPILKPGDLDITVRLLNTESGVVAAQQRVAVRADAPGVPLLQARDAVLERIAAMEADAGTEQVQNLTMLGARATALRLEGADLARHIAASAEKSPAEQDRLAYGVDRYMSALRNVERLIALLESAMKAGAGATFALWQDTNPWDNIAPIDSLPAEGGPLTVHTWAFGREIESIAVNAVNLTGTGMTLRVEPGQLFRKGEEQPLGAAENVATVMRPVWLPSRFGEVVPDLLPPLGDGYLLDIAPGEVGQLWFNLSTHDLEAGSYELRWPIHTLDQPPVEQELTIALEVSPVRLPEKSRFLTGYWSRNNIGDFSTVPNLNEHLQTLWYQLPLPPARADAQGNLVGELDWTAHDAILKEAAQVDLILYSGPPMPQLPEGVEATPELEIVAKRNYVAAMVEHLRGHGLDYENFCFYVEDETGLHGEIESFMKTAKRNREIDPRMQNYANPWGGITVDNIRTMAPYTDVWQPGMETIEFLGPDYVDAMREGDERIAMYTPPGNCRILRPLGFYRAQPWQAFHWGIEGGGWWVYYQGVDLFATDPNEEPSYAAINYDGRALVNSRRWEAQRDGIEDFNAITMLREQAEARNDTAALRTLQEAVDYVAAETITGMPRESADYDMDFETFSAMRLKIREALERLQP